MTPPNVLVSWYTDPRYIAPFILSPSQTNVGPRLSQDQPQLCFAGWTPIGSYDLHDAVKGQSLNAAFDLIVVMTDASGTNRPYNVAEFGVPTILCVGDTHHMTQPLRGLLNYALRVGYDFIVVPYNRQHLHWFVEAGCRNVAWLPGLTAHAHEGTFFTDRKPHVAFVGQAGQYHPRRRRLLSQLHLNNIPVNASQRPLLESLRLYAESQISFNCSLNGDLNLRIFEILSAGGCLLTDRLASQSGLHLLLREDEEYLAYSTADELIEKCHSMLADPRAALHFARCGSAAYEQKLDPRQRVRDLLRWVRGDRLDPIFLPAVQIPERDHRQPINLMSRIAVYETLQERHRLFERQRVLIDAALPPAYHEDASDLMRLEIATVDFSQLDKVQNTSCDILVVESGRMVPPWLRAELVLHTGAGSPAPPKRRLDPCPCGSGRKYKHCCGQLV